MQYDRTTRGQAGKESIYPLLKRIYIIHLTDLPMGKDGARGKGGQKI